MASPDSGGISAYKKGKIFKELKKNWDLFYKRNESRFFKDRHWLVREFNELEEENLGKHSTLLELGCGAGNLLFPLLEDNVTSFIFACDFSPEAIKLIKSHPLYDESKLEVFECDIVKESLTNYLGKRLVDFATLVFVLSSIPPEHFIQVLRNIVSVLNVGGLILFRDYGINDLAQLRFHKRKQLSHQLYARQDGTLTYFFTIDELQTICEEVGLYVEYCNFVHKEIVNQKEKIQLPRVFIQGKFRKVMYDQV